MAVDESTVWQSTYYPDGKRYCRTNTDGSIYYLYDGGKAIATYDTDWDIRESFGYGLGSRDPIVNTQFYDGQEAFYYVKDGFGNVDIVLDADEATAATIGLTACGVPDPAGDYDSDIQFAAGSMWWDADVQAYVTSRVAPDPANPIPLNLFLGECGQCATEVGLGPWDPRLLDPNPDPRWPIPVPPWAPPFASPLPGNPVTLDAGDAGLGLGWSDLEGSEIHNPEARHSNGIDWAAKAYKSRPVAIANYKTRFMPDVFFEMTKRYSLPDSQVPDPDYVPDWRKKANGLGTGIRYAGYKHSFRAAPSACDGRSTSLTYKKGTEVALTNRLAKDSNFGPHLHLFLKDDDAKYSELSTGDRVYTGPEWDAAWQEKYFPAMPEIPLHIYLTAVCRYGWTQNTFSSYSNDWNLKWGAPASLHCMWTGGGAHAYGDCASRCQGAVAMALGGKAHCNEAHGDPMFYPTSDPQTEGEHTGCAACCDTRFSDFLLGYAGWASGYGLPMDNLANATDEGYIKMEWTADGLPLPRSKYYNIPGYILDYLFDETDIVGLYRYALDYMGEQMLTAWQMATDKVGGENKGTTCADLGVPDGQGGWLLEPGNDPGPGWCEMPDALAPRSFGE